MGRGLSPRGIAKGDRGTRLRRPNQSKKRARGATRVDRVWRRVSGFCHKIRNEIRIRIRIRIMSKIRRGREGTNGGGTPTLPDRPGGKNDAGVLLAECAGGGKI